MPSQSPLSVPPEVKTNLPFFQILGELHPFKRLLVIPHLDATTITSLADLVLFVFRVPLDSASRQKINALVRAHEAVFKSIVTQKDGADTETLKKQFFQIGAGPLGLLLSIAIPLILGRMKHA